MRRPGLKVGVELDRTGGDDVQQRRHVHRQDRQADDRQRSAVRSSGQPSKPIPEQDHGAQMVEDRRLSLLTKAERMPGRIGMNHEDAAGFLNAAAQNRGPE
jgi:hypothetical protein